MFKILKLSQLKFDNEMEKYVLKWQNSDEFAFFYGLVENSRQNRIFGPSRFKSGWFFRSFNSGDKPHEV